MNISALRSSWPPIIKPKAEPVLVNEINRKEEKHEKNFGAKPYLFPQPVMIIGTYEENVNPNARNAAGGGRRSSLTSRPIRPRIIS